MKMSTRAMVVADERNARRALCSNLALNGEFSARRVVVVIDSAVRC
jgi:hypothetical protein